jgi:hypothetical protein
MLLSPTAIGSSRYLFQERRCLREGCPAVSLTEQILRQVTIPVSAMMSPFTAAKSLHTAAQKDALMHQCKGGTCFIMNRRVRDHCTIAPQCALHLLLCSFELIPIFDGSVIELTRLTRQFYNHGAPGDVSSSHISFVALLGDPPFGEKC